MAKKSRTSAEKAAIIVIALGAQNASEIYKNLRNDEVEQLSMEVAKMDKLPPEDLLEIVSDFYNLCVTQKIITEGGVVYAREVLEKAFGAQQAVSLMERVSKSLRIKAFNYIRKADYKTLLMILQNEHPQTIALVLSYARAEQASQILTELPRDLQFDVIARIAKLDRAVPEIINVVESTLEEKISSIASVDLMEIGGVKYVADIMNHVDRGTEKFIFDELNVNDPVLSEEVRRLMFVVEDFVYLASLAIQRFIRECDSKDIAVALKVANQEVQELIYSNMSQRMQENIKTDIQYLHNVRMHDVEQAQQRIVATIRKLEEEGEIVISKGGKDEINA